MEVSYRYQTSILCGSFVFLLSFIVWGNLDMPCTKRLSWIALYSNKVLTCNVQEMRFSCLTWQRSHLSHRAGAEGWTGSIAHSPCPQNSSASAFQSNDQHLYIKPVKKIMTYALKFTRFYKASKSLNPGLNKTWPINTEPIPISLFLHWKYQCFNLKFTVTEIMAFIFLFLENEWDLHVCMCFKDTSCPLWWFRIFGLSPPDRNPPGREMFPAVPEALHYPVHLDAAKLG